MYAWCVKYMDPEKREMWDAQLNDALPDMRPDRPSQRVAEDEGDLFMTAMAQHKQLAG